jgi:hypothetical protein
MWPVRAAKVDSLPPLLSNEAGGNCVGLREEAGGRLATVWICGRRPVNWAAEGGRRRRVVESAQGRRMTR